VNTGSLIEYTISLANATSDIAEDVRLQITLTPDLVFLELTADDGFGGNNIGCISLPTAGSADAPIDCTNFSIAPGATTTYTLRAQVGNCIGAGIDITNTVSITTLSTDPNAANDQATVSFTTAEDGTCNDLLCDGFSCITDACTVNDHCDAGACVSEPANCDDNSLCTSDTCDPTATGDPCFHDSSQLGDLCFDGNDCTLDACAPLLFCVFPAGPPDAACDDFLSCTISDHCNDSGICISQSVCDDGQPCTDDFADELNSCACTNPLSFPGSVCDDGSVCTSATTCDGLGGGPSNCNGGTTLDCNDGNPCTDDSCDPVLGCVTTNNTATCDDASVCTTGDSCSGGACTGGTPVVCNDGNVCTDDACNPASGCVATNNTAPCNDGNICTTSDTCGGGSCQAGTPVPNCCLADAACNDGNACTSDYCNTTNDAAVSFASPGAIANHVDLALGAGSNASPDYINFFGTSSFTIEGWIFTDGGAAASTGVFRHGRQGDFAQVVVQLGGTGNLQLLGSVEANAAGNDQVDVTSLTVLTANTWNPFALVVDRSGSQ
jgi:hypothetical protein